MNNTAMNAFVRLFVFGYVFSLLLGKFLGVEFGGPEG